MQLKWSHQSPTNPKSQSLLGDIWWVSHLYMPLLPLASTSTTVCSTNAPKSMNNKFQRVLNCSEKLIFHGKKYNYVTPLLRQLHWLPLEQRIQYKILTLSVWNKSRLPYWSPCITHSDSSKNKTEKHKTYAKVAPEQLTNWNANQSSLFTSTS